VGRANTADDGQFSNRLSLSGDGNTLAIGAPNEGSPSTGVNGNQTQDPNFKGAGAVYVFTRSSGTWSQQAYLKASNTGASDSFGFSVSLSGDGGAVAVGAIGDDSNSAGVDGDDKNELAQSSGAVFLFRRAGTSWFQEHYIKASNPDASDVFGLAVALAADANTLVVTAPGEASKARGIGGDQSDNSAKTAGAAYVFARDGASWKQEAYIKASNADAGDAFGWSVALASDGSSLAIGAYLEASEATGIDGDATDNNAMGAGAAYFFARAAGSWKQTAYLKGSNTGAGDSFGVSVSLAGDGQSLLIGASAEDGAATGIEGDQTSNAVMQSGAAYLFSRAGDSWKQTAYIKASNTAAGSAFGVGTAVSYNGRALIIGASDDASDATGVNGNQADRSASQAGAAYLFTR
jgi:FG-GAP repeat